MFRLLSGAAAIALAAPLALPAAAATDADLADIRNQIRELREQYEARIRSLEQRLKEAEAKAAAPAPVAAAPAPAPVAAASAAAPTSNAFNPAISAILSGTYSRLTRDPSTFAIAGFQAGGEIGPGSRSFSLGESELVLSANADPHVSGTAIFSISPENEIAVEEAFAQWNTAPFGLLPKAGRFLSGVGYLNETHPHAWDFTDAPLAYQAFLGGRYGQDGVQLRWLAPTDTYLELGAEAGRGSNFPGSERGGNGANAYAVFAHTGGDIGSSHSWRAGLSYLATRAIDRVAALQDPDGAPVDVSFTGRSRVAIADFVWKYAPGGNGRERNFKLQGEVVMRRERGTLATAAAEGDYKARQWGGYVQGVYQWHPQWRAGLRYDRLDPGSVSYGDNEPFLASAGFKPKRVSAMVDYNPSEFSRIRLQLARSETAPGVTDNQLFVQYILSLGAHGAHRY